MRAIIFLLLSQHLESLATLKRKSSTQLVPAVVYTTYPRGVDGSKWRQSVEAHAGTGVRVALFTDEEMAKSVCEIDNMLVDAGILGARQAFANLRPGAYKADLWRYMVLWAYGGIYLDESVRLMANLSSWLDWQSDRLMLIADLGESGYWNAIMAAPPRHVGIEFAIRQLIVNVQWRFYGNSCLDVTGPNMLFAALAQLPGSDSVIDVRYSLKAVENCGDPCEVVVVEKDPPEGERPKIIAEKTTEDRATFDGPEHYPELWKERCIYCDDIGFNCDAAKTCQPLPEDCELRTSGADGVRPLFGGL